MPKYLVLCDEPFTSSGACPGTLSTVQNIAPFEISLIDPALALEYFAAGLTVVAGPILFIWGARLLLKQLLP